MTRPRATFAAGPTALALIEDAVHLLRRAPAAVWLFHFLGAGLWVLAILFAWAYVSWFRPTRDELAAGALLLVMLYAWLKTAQSELCARLMSLCLGAPAEKFTFRRAVRLAAAQFAPHALGPAILTIAGVITIPFAQAWLYFQNLTVLGAENKTDAMPLAKLWPRQGWAGLLVITALALLVFINLAMAFYLMPSLARALLGVDNFMSVSGWSKFNTTFLMSVAALTWFAVDPIVKAFCVLRVFHGRARRTGADLLIEMEHASKPRRAATAVLVALVLFASASLLPCARTPAQGAATSPPPDARSAPPSATTVAPADLNRAIDEVLTRGEFRWQMPPAKTQTDDDSNFITRLFNWLYDILKSVARAVDNFITWLRDVFSRNNYDAMPEPRPTTESGQGMPLLQLFLYGLVAVLVGLLIWIFLTAWRKSDPTALTATKATPDTTATPDLRDENVQAAQLPADGWLKLAREQAALGEWRLALRALYLAHLARLDSEGLLTLKRYKTNLDYERELRRRALQRAALGDWFAARRREFEQTWYGRARPDAEQVRLWFDEVEKGAPAA